MGLLELYETRGEKEPKAVLVVDERTRQSLADVALVGGNGGIRPPRVGIVSCAYLDAPRVLRALVAGASAMVRVSEHRVVGAHETKVDAQSLEPYLYLLPSSVREVHAHRVDVAQSETL